MMPTFDFLIPYLTLTLRNPEVPDSPSGQETRGELRFSHSNRDNSLQTGGSNSPARPPHAYSEQLTLTELLLL